MINQTRFFITEKANIPTNIANGTINANDLVITSDTHELYFVDENNNYFPITTTKEELGINNVTNDAQIKGKASGTTENHVLTWGVDGYTVKDSGYTINKSVPANAVFTDTTYSEATSSASGLMSANDKSALDKLKEIDVDEVATQLQSLYVKLGGDNSETASSIDEWIDKIEDVAGPSSGGSSSADSDTYYLDLLFVPARYLIPEDSDVTDTVRNNTFIYTTRPADEYTQAFEEHKRMIVTIVEAQGELSVPFNGQAYTIPSMLDPNIRLSIVGDHVMAAVSLFHDGLLCANGILAHSIYPEEFPDDNIIPKEVPTPNGTFYLHSPFSGWNLTEFYPFNASGSSQFYIVNAVDNGDGTMGVDKEYDEVRQAVAAATDGDAPVVLNVRGDLYTPASVVSANAIAFYGVTGIDVNGADLIQYVLYDDGHLTSSVVNQLYYQSPVQ